MTEVQAIFIAILQGLTELFPVSSLGHAVVLPRLLGWDLDENAAYFLPFLVVLHLGTAAALVTVSVALALVMFDLLPAEPFR